MKANLTGLFPPLTTPFDDDRIVPERLVENIARYEALGVRGYLVLGSTGEAAVLDEDEKLRLVGAARRAMPREQTLIAGVGLEGTAATIRLAERAAGVGADLALVLTPFYFRERMTDDALFRHYTAVADASPIPVLLYNVPKFTGIALAPGLVERLASHPNIVGIKDSAGDLGALSDIVHLVPSGFRVLCGSVSIFADALAAGACGGILAAADVFPEPLVAIEAAHRTGRGDEARAIEGRVLPACRRVADAGVPGIKAAMDLRALHGGPPRPPLMPATDAAREALSQTIESLVAAGALSRLDV